MLCFFPRLGLKSYSDTEWIFLINRKRSSPSAVYKNQFGPKCHMCPPRSRLFSLSFPPSSSCPPPPLKSATKPKSRAQLTLPVTAVTTPCYTHTHTHTHKHMCHVSVIHMYCIYQWPVCVCVCVCVLICDLQCTISSPSQFGSYISHAVAGNLLFPVSLCAPSLALTGVAGRMEKEQSVLFPSLKQRKGCRERTQGTERESQREREREQSTYCKFRSQTFT